MGTRRTVHVATRRPDDLITTQFVADDVDQAWDELEPYLKHDVTIYPDMDRETRHVASFSFVSTVDERRAANASHRIVNVTEAVAYVRLDSPLPLLPSCQRTGPRHCLVLYAHRGQRGAASHQLSGPRDPTELNYQNGFSLVSPRVGKAPATMGWQLPRPSAPVTRSRNRTTVSRIWWS